MRTTQGNRSELAAWWAQHAKRFFADFTEEGDSHRIVLLNAILLDMLCPAPGKRMLDVGCGEGYLARMLAAKGASVTGVERSGAVLSLARMRTQGGTVDLCQADCEQLPFSSGPLFDSAVSVLVFDCVADIQEAFKEVARVLRPKGQFVLVLPHPCFITPHHGWHLDEEGGKKHWAVDRYFQEGMMRTPIPGCDEELAGVHRTLGTYWREVKKAGFVVHELREPQPNPALLARHPSFVDDFRMSQFLVLDLRKCE